MKLLRHVSFVDCPVCWNLSYQFSFTCLHRVQIHGFRSFVMLDACICAQIFFILFASTDVLLVPCCNNIKWCNTYMIFTAPSNWHDDDQYISVRNNERTLQVHSAVNIWLVSYQLQFMLILILFWHFLSYLFISWTGAWHSHGYNA